MNDNDLYKSLRPVCREVSTTNCMFMRLTKKIGRAKIAGWNDQQSQKD